MQTTHHDESGVDLDVRWPDEDEAPSLVERDPELPDHEGPAASEEDWAPVDLDWEAIVDEE